MVRFVHDRKHAVFQRINDLVAVHIVNGDLAGGIALDGINSVKQDVLVVGGDLDHFVRTHFQVHDMDDTVCCGGHDHIDNGAVP